MSDEAVTKQPMAAPETPRRPPSPRAIDAITTAAAAATRNARPANTTTAASTLPAKPSGRMSLSKVVSGRVAKPMRVLLYGIEGVGKSSFAASAPAGIFLGAEDGTAELDVERFPQPRSWPDVMEAIQELTDASHDYRTLVIDTIDWLEPICWQHVCATRVPAGKPPAPSIETFSYGKGYVEAMGLWRQLTAALERLREARKMDMVILAHSWIKPYKNPAGEDYDRFEMKLHKTAAGHWREWADAVLFAAHDVATYETDNKRTKGIASGARVIHTQHDAAWDAKNRYDLPPHLPLDWTAFIEAATARSPDDPSRIRAQIERTLAEVSDQQTLVTRVSNSVVAAGDDAAELARILNKLAAKISTTPTDDEEQTQ